MAVLVFLSAANVSFAATGDLDGDSIANARDEDCPDLDGLSPVGFIDFSILVDNWQIIGPNLPGDLNTDGIVDINDLAILAAYWLGDCFIVSVSVGPEGGSLQLGRFEVVVPPDLLPESVEISVRELPSQADEVAQDLDPARVRPIGPAFQFEAPFLSNEPLTLTLTYEESDIPDGFDAQNLAILIRLECYPESFGEGSLEELVMFVPLPADVNEQERMVAAEIFGGGTFQLAALAEHLEVEVASLKTESKHFFNQAFAQPPIPLNPFGIVFWEVPPGWTLMERDYFSAVVLDAINAAYQKLVIQKGFPGPLPQVTVDVRKINRPGAPATVSYNNPLHIIVDPFKFLSMPAMHFPSLMAHEYFHVIQIWNSNPASRANIDDNRWFYDGTAEWAMDEVFDTVSGHYIAPTGKRFEEQLNANDTTSEERKYLNYETVAFWKWLETEAPGLVLGIIEHHRFLTHKGLWSPIVTSVSARYLDSLTTLHQDLNFLMFATDALYWKDFDQDETGQGDLWDPKKLGQSGDVPAFFREPQTNKIIRLKKGGAGDGKANKESINYMLSQHLTADVYIITNGEGAEALCGTLHIEFTAASDPKFVAAVISRDTDKEKLVTDLSTAKEVKFGFGSDSEVVVIIVDPQWEAPVEGNLGAGIIDAWVEHCGGETPPGAFTWNVSSVEELYNAVENASGGDTILLAPGNYSLPLKQWDEFGGVYANLVLNKYVTLAGSGKDNTTLNIYGVYFAQSGIWVGYEEAKVTLRDLKISSYTGHSPFYAPGATRFSLCNVAVESCPSAGNWGIQWNPVDAGGKLELHGTDFIYLGSCPEYVTALEISPYTAGDPPIEVVIRDSNISNWWAGIGYASYPHAGTANLTLDVDCASFFGNQWNVLEYPGTYPYQLEHCPGGP